MSHPPPRSIALSVLLLLIAMVSIQTGASLAKTLFHTLGAPGTVTLRTVLATLMLAMAMKPWRERITAESWRPLLIYGVAFGVMNFLYYMALRTLPLGITVALEFIGPLGVAALALRRPLDFLWILLAGGGLLLLLPIGRAGVDPTGVLFALGAGGCWALYIVFGQRAGAYHGARTVALGSIIAMFIVVPIGAVDAGRALLAPAVLPFGLAIALLSTAFPYTLEMIALTRMPARTFGILMSIEPAIGALAGWALLAERLAASQWAAIAMIIVASVGTTSTSTATPQQPVAVPMPE